MCTAIHSPRTPQSTGIMNTRLGKLVDDAMNRLTGKKPLFDGLKLPDLSPQDGVTLSKQAKSNPYEGFTSQAKQVTVASGDSLSVILNEMGYSGKEMYGKNGVIARVLEANPDLKNPNLIKPGQKLNLPVKEGAQDAEKANSVSTLPLEAQSASQLEQTAKSARDQGKSSFEKMYQHMSDLNDEDRKAVGRSMFYETAVETGYFGDMTAKQIKELIDSRGPDFRKKVEQDIHQWTSDFPIRSSISMARGANLWVARNLEHNTSETNSTLLGIEKNATASLEHNTLAAATVGEMGLRDTDRAVKLYSEIR